MAQTHLHSHQQLMNDPTLFTGQVPLIAHGDSWFSFGDFFPTRTRSLLDFCSFGRDVGIGNFVVLDTRGVSQPAEAGSTGRSGDWQNEIHLPPMATTSWSGAATMTSWQAWWRATSPESRETSPG